jgi:hypothetical protein
MRRSELVTNQRDDETDEDYERRAKEEAMLTSAANPFDPRSEVSADARHIVKHLWAICVLLPLALGALALLFGTNK